MNDPWALMLKDLVPEYDDLVEAMQFGPNITVTLESLNKEWKLSINEKWGVVDDAGSHFNSKDFDDRVNWSAIELEKWNCRRTSWNIWNFKSKRDAEKFITIFTIKWAE